MMNRVTDKQVLDMLFAVGLMGQSIERLRVDVLTNHPNNPDKVTEVISLRSGLDMIKEIVTELPAAKKITSEEIKVGYAERTERLKKEYRSYSDTGIETALGENG